MLYGWLVTQVELPPSAAAHLQLRATSTCCNAPANKCCLHLLQRICY